jgi:hypothetical protein
MLHNYYGQMKLYNKCFIIIVVGVVVVVVARLAITLAIPCVHHLMVW